MPIVGSFAGASSRAYGLQAGGALGDYESISTTTLSGTQATITFSSIPQNYIHLQIRVLARSNRASTFDGVAVQFNSDTAGNYSDHNLNGDGASATSSASTSSSNMNSVLITGASATASIFGVGVIDILDYTNTNKYTTIRTIGGADNNGSGNVRMASGNWRNTNAVTSISLISVNGASFVQYSSFALYGIKG